MLTDAESRIWQALTDEPRPDEAPAGPAIRVFSLRPGDSRWPGQVVMPRMNDSASARLRRHWVSTLVAELLGDCPCCSARRRPDEPTLIHSTRCELRGFGRRLRRHVDPMTLVHLSSIDPVGLLSRMP